MTLPACATASVVAERGQVSEATQAAAGLSTDRVTSSGVAALVAGRVAVQDVVAVAVDVDLAPVLVSWLRSPVLSRVATVASHQWLRVLVPIVRGDEEPFPSQKVAVRNATETSTAGA